jgi:hypothetical protein
MGMIEPSIASDVTLNKAVSSVRERVPSLSYIVFKAVEDHPILIVRLQNRILPEIAASKCKIADRANGRRMMRSPPRR